MNEAQRLALSAATDGPDEARRSWAALVDRYDLADLWDHEVYRLLPLVWHRLGDEVGAEHVDRLKGIYRKTWVTNQHLRRQGGEAVAALAAEGIDSLVLRGAALGAMVYEDQATRPLVTVHLLVRPDDAVAAWRLLEGLGYRARSAPAVVRSSWRQEPDDGWYLRCGHPRSFDRGTLDVVDLHTTLAPALAAADVTELWDRAVAIRLGEVTASTLSPVDHLFHALALGWRGPDLVRLVDARALAGRADVDPAALVVTAERHHAGLLVAEGLADLGRRGPVTPAVDRRERLAGWLRGRDLDAAALYVTGSRGLGPAATVARAPGFVADRWQLAHRRHLPLAMAQRLRHRWRD